MIGRTKFIASVVKSAKQNPVDLPWVRGTRREAFITKRTSKSLSLKRA